MTSPKRRAILATLVVVTGLAVTGLAWLLTHKPVTLLQTDTWVCAHCAEQRSASSRKVFEIRGPLRSNVFSTPIHQVLSPGGNSPCNHSWVHVHEWKDFLYVYPKIQAHLAIHLFVNLDGIEKDTGFAAALNSIVQTNPPLARECWSTLLEGFSRPPTAEIQQLRDMLAAKSSPAVIADQLKLLNLKAGPSAP